MDTFFYVQTAWMPPRYCRYRQRLILRRRRRKKDRTNLGWEGVSGSLTSATIQVNFDCLQLTRLLACCVQLVSRFWHHLRCIIGNIRDFPDLPFRVPHENCYFGAFRRFVHVVRERDSRTLWSFGIRGSPPLTLIALHTFGPGSLLIAAVVNEKTFSCCNTKK